MGAKEDRLEMIVAMGGKCKECGYANIYHLEIHHEGERLGIKYPRYKDVQIYKKTGYIPPNLFLLCDETPNDCHKKHTQQQLNPRSKVKWGIGYTPPVRVNQRCLSRCEKCGAQCMKTEGHDSPHTCPRCGE